MTFPQNSSTFTGKLQEETARLISSSLPQTQYYSLAQLGLILQPMSVYGSVQSFCFCFKGSGITSHHICQDHFLLVIMLVITQSLKFISCDRNFIKYEISKQMSVHECHGFSLDLWKEATARTATTSMNLYLA